MNYSSHIKLVFSAVLCCVVLAFIPGCGSSPDEVKTLVDADAYNIINSKWDKNFGEKTNFKISDTEPSADAIVIDKSIPESGIVTLEHAVSLATAHNRKYQTEKEAVYLKAVDLRLVRHEFELQYFGGGFGVFNHFNSLDGIEGGQDFRRVLAEEEPLRTVQYDAQGNPYGGEPRFNSESSVKTIGGRSDLGFNLLLATGARIGAKISANWGRIITDGFGTSLVSILTTEIVQPLLRGSNRTVIMDDLTQAERDTLYQIRTFNRFRKQFVVEVITNYYRILQLEDELNNAEENYRALKDIYKRMETLTEGGQLPRYELEQARQDQLNALNEYIEIKKVFRQKLDELKITLSLPTTTAIELNNLELTALTIESLDDLGFDEEDAIATALETRLDLANSADSVLDAKRKVEVAADALGMELNLVASARGPLGDSQSSRFENLDIGDVMWYDSAKQLYVAEIDEIFSAGLEFDLGLDKVAEENKFRKSLITVSQRQRDYEQATDEVVLDVRQSYRNLREAYDRHLVQTRSLKLAQRRVDNTFLLLQYSSRGNRRASTRDVLDAHEDMYKARNEATDALVDYNIAILEFYRDTGVLQVKPDGMWRKATAAK